MRVPQILLGASLFSLSLGLACGDKDGDSGHTGHTGHTADGGTADGGSADGGTADGASADGGTADGGTADGGTAIVIDCETDAWAAMGTSDEKSAFMATCVVPVMKPIFQDLDSERFSKFSCDTCHGADYNGYTFEMPNAVGLDWSASDTWPAGFSETMAHEVGPTMANILDYEPYDYKTGEGFGCGGCHMP